MISVVINGQRFFHVSSCTVTTSMDTVCNVFNMTISDRWTQAKVVPMINPNDPCQVFIGENRIIDGFIDKVNPQFTSSSNSINISGRDKTADLIDCSVVHDLGQWNGLKLDRIIKDICKPFNINVLIQTDIGAAISYFQIEQGMSAFDAIEKLCSLKAVLAISDDKGNIVITRAGDEKIKYILEEGINIEAASANYDGSKRFSSYNVKGQALPTGFVPGNDAFSGSATVVDKNVPRYRPLVILESAPVNSGTCQTVAKWELAKRRGQSRNFKVTKKGLLQDDLSLWPLNKKIHLTSPRLGVDDDLLIAGVEYHTETSGEFVVFTLTPQEAYDVVPDLTLEKPKGTPSLFGNDYINT